MLSEQIIRAEPDLIALEPIVRAASEAVAGSAAFRSVVRGAAYQAHASVFGGKGDSFALTVAGGALLVVQALETRDPEAAAQIPEGLRTQLASVSDGDFGAALTDLAQVAEDVEVLGWVALALALASLVALLARSGERRRNVRALALAVAVVGVILAVGLEVGRAIVSGQGDDDLAQASIRSIWDEFLGGLFVFNLALAATGLIVAAVADSRIRAIAPAERMRALAGAVMAPPSRTWVRVLRALALACAGIFLLVSPDAALRLAAAAVGLLLVAIAADEIISLTALPPGEEPTPRRRTALRRPALVALG